MQALIEMIAGFLVMLAAVVLAQFGVDLSAPRGDPAEVHRVRDCGDDKTATFVAAKPPADSC